MTADLLRDLIPDVRDGLTRKERMILYCLQQAQQDFKGRGVPTITLYGRVLEKVDISQEEFQLLLNRLTGMTRNTTADQEVPWEQGFAPTTIKRDDSPC